jgi:hypothetical protein
MALYQSESPIPKIAVSKSGKKPSFEEIQGMALFVFS